MKTACLTCALVPANNAISPRKQLIKVTRSIVVIFLTGFSVSACVLNQPSPAANGASVSEITIRQAQSDPDLFVNNEQQTAATDKPVVRWGGTIARIENQAGQQTLLEIVSRPLNGAGRPLHNDRSDGRFLALVPRFLDPEIVKVGRDVTVLGELTALNSGKIGETVYQFPLLKVKDFRYWRKQVAVQPTHYPYWSLYPYPYNDPFWHLRSRKNFLKHNQAK